MTQRRHTKKRMIKSEAAKAKIFLIIVLVSLKIQNLWIHESMTESEPYCTACNIMYMDL